MLVTRCSNIPHIYSRDYPDKPAIPDKKMVGARRDVTRWEWRDVIINFAFINDIFLGDHLHQGWISKTLPMPTGINIGVDLVLLYCSKRRC